MFHYSRALGEVVFSAESQPHGPMTRGNANRIGDVVRAHIGHWAIAEENSHFFVLCAYHTAAGRESWKQLHCAMTRGELDKAAEAPRNEKGDALREYASIWTVLIGAIETRSRTMLPLRDSARIVAIERSIESPRTRSVACMFP